MESYTANTTDFIIVHVANKVNLDVLPFPDSWTQIRFFLGIIPASLLGEQGINGCFAHLCVCRWEFPSPFSHIRVAARFCETLPLAPCEPSEKQKDGAGHQVFF